MPSINTFESSNDCMMLIIRFISSFEINKVNLLPALTAFFPLTFLSITLLFLSLLLYFSINFWYVRSKRRIILNSLLFNSSVSSINACNTYSSFHNNICISIITQIQILNIEILNLIFCCQNICRLINHLLRSIFLSQILIQMNRLIA